MRILDDLFSGGQQQAYQDLFQDIDQGMHQRQQYLEAADHDMQPYAQAGQSGLNQYQNYLSHLGSQLSNGNWMGGYQQSPYATFQTKEALKAANQAASASGLLGSGANQENNMKLAANISSHDMQNYFNNLFHEQGLYQSGLTNLANMGYGAANQMGNWNLATSQGIANDYANEGAALANKDKAQANMMNNILGSAGFILGAVL